MEMVPSDPVSLQQEVITAQNVKYILVMPTPHNNFTSGKNIPQFWVKRAVNFTINFNKRILW